MFLSQRLHTEIEGTARRATRSAASTPTRARSAARARIFWYTKRRLRIDPPEQAVAMTRLCWHRFRVNEAGLWLSLIAYILGNLWRRLPPGR